MRMNPLMQAARMGRNGDTMIAHINPREAALLKARGGSGTINPHTGLPEFYEGSGGFGFGADMGGDVGDGRGGADTGNGADYAGMDAMATGNNPMNMGEVQGPSQGRAVSWAEAIGALLGTATPVPGGTVIGSQAGKAFGDATGIGTGTAFAYGGQPISTFDGKTGSFLDNLGGGIDLGSGTPGEAGGVDNGNADFYQTNDPGGRANINRLLQSFQAASAPQASAGVGGNVGSGGGGGGGSSAYDSYGGFSSSSAYEDWKKNRFRLNPLLQGGVL